MPSEMRDAGVALFDRWTQMWNGHTELAPVIMASHFDLHYAQANTEPFDSAHTPEALAVLIDGWHRYRPGIRFSTEAHCVVELELKQAGLFGQVARPYLASFKDAQGQEVARSGIDLLRVSDGRIVEVWSVSSGAAGRTF
jgi:hypothetical protein